MATRMMICSQFTHHSHWTGISDTFTLTLSFNKLSVMGKLLFLLTLCYTMSPFIMCKRFSWTHSLFEHMTGVQQNIFYLVKQIVFMMHIFHRVWHACKNRVQLGVQNWRHVVVKIWMELWHMLSASISPVWKWALLTLNLHQWRFW